MTSDSHWHFTGKYRGVFKTKASGYTHAAVFYDFSLAAIEISDIKKIPLRDPEKERVGDFHYERVIKPKSRWSLGGVDISILADNELAYSESIYEVVLLHQSEPSEGFSPIRKFKLLRTSEQEFILEGTIYFSIPKEPIITTPSNQEAIHLEPKNEIPNITGEPSTNSSNATVSPLIIESQDISLSNRKGCLPTGTTSPGCLNAGGCFSLIFKLIRWCLIGILILSVLGYLSKLLTNRVDEQKREKKDGEVESSDLKLDPNQDTLMAQPWNYLMDHDVKWTDFIENKFHAKYTTTTYNLALSSKMHNSWSTSNVTDELLFYHDIYQDFYRGDSKKLDSLVDYFNTQRQIKNLDLASTADMVVTFVQEIPYVLIHDGTCREACLDGGFIADYHEQKRPCVSDVIAGVYSPYEFIHTLDGDCDTRSLLAYSILDKLGIGASIWVSREYGHSIAGIAVPTNSPNYKTINGIRYFAVELTAKGFHIGMIAPEHTDMNNWNIVLYNR